MQNAPALWETAWKFLIKLNIHLSYDPAIPLLDIYPRERKPYGHTKSCSWMFIVALFIITPNWKQSKCPSTGERYTNNGILLRNKREPMHIATQRIQMHPAK